MSFIHRLHAKRVGMFDLIDVKFNKRMNIVVGPNGSGKTSLLKCIIYAFSNRSLNETRYRKDPSLWVDIFTEEKVYRIGYSKMDIKSFNYRSLGYTGVKPPPMDYKYNYDDFAGRIYHADRIFRTNEDIIVNKTSFFLVIGAYRQIMYKKILGFRREENEEKQRKEYYNSAIENLIGILMPDVKQWLINRYFIIDKPWAEIEKKNWEYIMKKLDFIGLKNDSLKFVDIQRDMEPKFSIFGEICYLEELSAGYQSVLSLIFKIVDWIESTKKNDERLIVNANGTILIDELDVHLHPEWQLEIRNTLLTLFPKLQFIVTTHSPHIIASADVNEVIIMPKHQKTINIEPSPFCYKGWRTDDILRDLMSVGNLNSRKYYNLVKKANNFYAQNNKPSFMKCIEEIEKIAHPSDSIITVLKIKLAEMSLEEKSDDCAKAK